MQHGCGCLLTLSVKFKGYMWLCGMSVLYEYLVLCVSACVRMQQSSRCAICLRLQMENKCPSLRSEKLNTVENKTLAQNGQPLICNKYT